MNATGIIYLHNYHGSKTTRHEFIVVRIEANSKAEAYTALRGMVELLKEKFDYELGSLTTWTPGHPPISRYEPS